MQRILDLATGVFREDFEQRSKPFIEVVKAAQSKSEGTVTDAGLESQRGDSAQVLVAVAVKSRTAGGEEAPGNGACESRFGRSVTTPRCRMWCSCHDDAQRNRHARHEEMSSTSEATPERAADIGRRPEASQTSPRGQGARSHGRAPGAVEVPPGLALLLALTAGYFKWVAASADDTGAGAVPNRCESPARTRLACCRTRRIRWTKTWPPHANG